MLRGSRDDQRVIEDVRRASKITPRESFEAEADMVLFRTARKKCSEAKPECAFCTRNGLKCEVFPNSIRLVFNGVV